ncbi:MAG: hypothetical protein GW886_13775 [Rhodobacterales bacterium]|nr:hypothetical protein [Rhodobacterales bacterium]NCT12920.1 hypothetical protein [Rhodobacterales bacterium]
MTRARLVLGLLVAWFVLHALALMAFSWVAPTGDGFTRGMNRLLLAVGLQMAAAVLGVAAFVLGRALPPGHRLRRIAWVPLILAGLLVLAIAAPFALPR